MCEKRINPIQIIDDLLSTVYFCFYFWSYQSLSSFFRWKFYLNQRIPSFIMLGFLSHMLILFFPANSFYLRTFCDNFSILFNHLSILKYQYRQSIADEESGYHLWWSIYLIIYLCDRSAIRHYFFSESHRQQIDP